MDPMPPSQSPPSPSPQHGLYVFCVTAAARPPLRDWGLTADRPLLHIADGELAAVACQVALADWVGPEAEARLGDLSWLGPRAVRHQAVIDSALAAGPVLPLRFGSIFSSVASLTGWLRGEAPPILTFLRESAGQEEWSLKGWLNLAQAEAARLQTDPRFLALPASPGARYLREQKLRQDISKSVRSWGRQIEQRVLGELGGLCRRSRALPALAGQVSGRSDEVIFHQALLVPSGRRDELLARLDSFHSELSPQGLSLELTGPWPLYSFVPTLAGAPAAAAEAASG
jgi:hypothetical protein